METLRSRAFALFFSLLLAEAVDAQSALHVVQGAATPAAAGAAVASLPDVDGDGVADFAIGSPNEAPSGFVRVHSGRDGSVLFTWAGATPNASFGAALALVHDIDGGGLPDLMIGAPDTTWSHASQGTAYVYSLESGARWVQIFGGGTNARMGHAVANVGDVDGDGVDDFAAGEPGADFSTLVDNGAVWTISGATLEFIGVLRGLSAGEQFGFSLSAWGDVDLDGDDDFLVGAPFNSDLGQGGGRVYAVSGGSYTLWWTFGGGYAGEHFGMSVLGLGDTDGDGVVEFAVGAPDHSEGAVNRGRVGWFEGFSVQPHEEQVGVASERLGRALAALDFDGDGELELAAGAPNHEPAGVGRIGAVKLFDARTAAFERALTGFAANGEFGVALAGCADFNGDGAQELLVGARAESSHRGVARVITLDDDPPSSYCTAKTTSNGCTPRIGSSGAASASVGGGLRVRAQSVTPNAPGMLFFGAAPNSAPFHGGVLCVAQPVRRTPVQLSTVGTAGCSGSLEYVFTPAALAQFGLAPGAQVHAQFWWRDPGFVAPHNVGLSDALRFVVLP